MRRQYAGAAAAAQLTEALGGSTADLTIECSDLTNWPTGSIGPFYVVIDRETGSEEKILCVSRSGNTLTVYDDGSLNGRGADDTSPTAHSINAVIEHSFTATDANEANLHVNTNSLHIQSDQQAITICTSTTRPVSPTVNEIILETDTGYMLAYIDGQWEQVSSSNTGGGYPDLFLLMGA